MAVRTQECYICHKMVWTNDITTYCTTGSYGEIQNYNAHMSCKLILQGKKKLIKTCNRCNNIVCDIYCTCNRCISGKATDWLREENQILEAS